MRWTYYVFIIFVVFFQGDSEKRSHMTTGTTPHKNKQQRHEKEDDIPSGSGQLGSGKKKRLSFSQSQGHSPSEVCFFSAIQFESSSDTMNPFLIVKCKSLDVISICQFSQLYAFSDLNNFISMSYSTRYFFIKTPEKYQL